MLCLQVTGVALTAELASSTINAVVSANTIVDLPLNEARLDLTALPRSDWFRYVTRS
jgi:hypothetical protein